MTKARIDGRGVFASAPPATNSASALELYRPTRENIEHLFASYGIDHYFSRLIVMRELGIQRSNAGTFLAKLQTLNLIEPVQGEGRGKFRFRG